MSETKAIADLARSGISPEEAVSAGMFYEPNAKKLALNLDPSPVVAITYPDPFTRQPTTWGPDNRLFIRVRYLNKVTNHKGKVLRYSQPSGSPQRAYWPTPTDWPAVFKDTSQAIVITEGEKKALALSLQGVPCIGLGGVWNWRPGGKLLPELELPDYSGERIVVICYDSDAETNPQVRSAELALAAELQQRGAEVRIARLSPTADGAKRGIDDYIQAGEFDALLACLTAAVKPESLEQDVMALNAEVAYLEQEDCVYVIADDTKISKSAFMTGSRFSSRTTQGTRSVKGKPTSSEVPLAPIWLRHIAARRYMGTVFRPDTNEREIPTANGVLLNRWQGLKGTPGDVKPFFELTDYLLTNSPEASDIMLKLLAYRAQNPETKVPLAYVLIGPQGCGKSMWAKIVGNAFAPYQYSLNSAALKSDFQEWIETALIVVIDEAQAAHTIGAKDTLKNYISEQRHRANVKHTTAKQVDNYSTFILTSNDRRVGAFDGDDRRMIVISCPNPREAAFYDRLVAWEANNGPAHLMHYLLTYDLKGWTPPKRAPFTQEKRMAYLESLTPVQRLAEDMKTANANVLKIWIDGAMDWAQMAINGANPGEARFAKQIIAVLQHMQIRPWYTAEELCHIFPAITSQLYGSKKAEAMPAGAFSRMLRNENIPYLPSKDSNDGFRHQGRMQQFLVVCDPQEWTSVPLSQDDFERLIRFEFPTWRNYVA